MTELPSNQVFIKKSEVAKQATDGSLDNTEPVTFRQLAAQIVGIIVAVLIFKGYLEPSEGAALGVQSGVIVGAIMASAGILGAVAGRMKAYSPKTAAKIALTNSQAAYAAGQVNTQNPPPTLLNPS